MFFKFLIEFRLNPTLTVVCLFMYILFVCLFTYLISIISCSLKLEQITPPCQLCHAYYKVSNILYQILEDFLNVVFILIKFLIEFGLNPALAVVCLFIYILFVCLFTYFISIISRPQYDSTDTSNSNFCLLMIILLQNIYLYT